MTTAQAVQLSKAQHQPHAAHAARWTQQPYVFQPLLSRYGRAGQAAQQAQRLGIVCRSLHGVQVAANVSRRHPAANGYDFGGRAIWVSNSGDLNLTAFGLCGNRFVVQTLTGCEGGGLDLNKCLHVISPVVDASILAQDAPIKTTVRRKVANK